MNLIFVNLTLVADGRMAIPVGFFPISSQTLGFGVTVPLSDEVARERKNTMNRLSGFPHANMQKVHICNKRVVGLHQ